MLEELKLEVKIEILEQRIKELEEENRVLQGKVRERQYPWERDDKSRLVGFNQNGPIYWKPEEGIFAWTPQPQPPPDPEPPKK